MNLYKIFSFFIVVFTLLISGISTSFADMNSLFDSTALKVDLSSDSNSYENDQKIFVTLKITNIGTKPVSILKWHIPESNSLAIVDASMFKVYFNNDPVDYLGPLFKRNPPDSKDYLTLPAGQSIESTFEISSFFDFSKKGMYKIIFLPQNKSFITISVEGTSSPLSTFDVSMELNSIETNSSWYSNNCSEDQNEKLGYSLVQSKKYAISSYKKMQQISEYPIKYTNWFGEMTSSRVSRVTQNFYRISDALMNKKIIVSCSTCNGKKHLAYVFRKLPYVIYVCPAFWKSPLKGVNSKGGIIVHELSHFEVIAGTFDYDYGTEDSLSLAKTNPDKAILNADSHEYFAEYL